MSTITQPFVSKEVSVDILKKAYSLMCTAKAMTDLYEANKEVTAKYVHATSRGHEAIQIALGLQLLPQDYLSAYYRDDSITEGEVAEAFQMAVLKKLPILYLVQDNEWDISANAKEIRVQDASEYAKGFKGLETRTIDGTDFIKSYKTIEEVIELIRKE